MNPNFPQSPEDRLLDELLHEQNQGQDDAFLQQIEVAVDAGAPVLTKRPVGRMSARIAIAAAIMLAAGSAVWWKSLDRKSDQQIVAKAEKIQLVSKEPQRSEIEISRMAKSHLAIEPNEERRQSAAAEPPSTRELPESKPLADLAMNNKDSGANGSLTSTIVDEEIGRSNGPGGGKSAVGFGRGSGSGTGMGGAGSGKLFGLVAQPSDAPRPPAARSREIGGFVFPEETNAESTTGDRYGSFIDQPWKTSASDPLSTFSIDVDTASYGNVRRMIREGREIPRDAVRIEECINAFSYRYDPPKGDAAFAVGASLAVCPWAPEHQLVRIAIKGREIDPAKRPASNLVFLIDVSGSMQSPDKLPLLKQSMATLVNQLDERDRVAIVVYAGSEGVALPSTRLNAEGRATVLQTLSKLEAGGSTNGGAGIKRAYELAAQQKIEGGVNRVILATDGDFNVGVTGQSSLVDLVKDRAKGGVYLTVLGFGTGNLNDSMMDAITRDGNGNYFYIDSEREGRKVFLKNLTGTLVTIAKDVKIQVEFNPAKVGGYRLIGYANRVLRNEDFKNDKVDAGDIGAGHTVTAFYELTPPGATSGTDELKYQTAPPKPAGSNEWLTVKLRHKHPEGDKSSLTEFSLTGDAAALDKTDADFQFATAVALFGMKLRGMDEVSGTPWKKVLELARSGLADDASEDRAEFVGLVRKLGGVVETELSVTKDDMAKEENGPNVRTLRHEDGSRSVFVRAPDSRALDRKTFSKDGELRMKIVYRMDRDGNPLGGRIYDSRNNLMFKISYGYRKSDGQLVEERIFDAQVVRKDPDTGSEMALQRICYSYDPQGKRSEPIVYTLQPGKTLEEVFGIKTTVPDDNPFHERIVPPPAEVMPGNRR